MVERRKRGGATDFGEELRLGDTLSGREQSVRSIPDGKDD